MRLNEYCPDPPHITVIVTWGRKVPPHLDHTYPRYGKKQIFCGPYLRDGFVGDFQYISTSTLHFDIDEVISKIEDINKIDMFIADLEVGIVPFVKGLDKLACPKIGKIGDTFHGMYPLSSLIEYLQVERYDHLLSVAQPAHLHFFFEIGYKHCAALPRLGPSIDVTKGKIQRDIGVIYVGIRFSFHHVRRTLMLFSLERALTAQGIDFRQYTHTGHNEWLSLCSRSKIAVCSSSNNQFTPQIFYIMHTGCLCMVDELSQQTGVYRFFQPGKHFITWRSFSDLISKILYYSEHEDEAAAIARAGQEKAREYFPVEAVEGKIIYDFATRNILPSENFRADIDKRFNAVSSGDFSEKKFNRRIRFYENIQDLHRKHETLHILFWKMTDDISAIDVADLPRLNITCCLDETIIDKATAEAVAKDQGVTDITYVYTAELSRFGLFDICLLQADNESDDSQITEMMGYLKSSAVIFVFSETKEIQKNLIESYGFVPAAKSSCKNFLKRQIDRILVKLPLFLLPFGIYRYSLSLMPQMEMVEGLYAFYRKSGNTDFKFLFSFHGARMWWKYYFVKCKKIIKIN
ncbi:MAG: hypothetical protein DKM50_02730 [Candidatus Margulisiibacteriota bacterium]|nr:MAG: hypothetical protein A2X43_03495 [Candidatus Margulisbacteria bacterium GWD2_39_127]OGI04014.1 MAG: hypothetical protein A2X42_11740 [Candidatus Margulisbacteria bacterium GWF2_38_17]OGI06537.1 MAG: hypothetical protein A2X41_02620 [Candidatus Margulisbacteria bacterium GWE2_39_32]PZM83208.1 MAG: hypothetical protein DKM50_02730 [Candidatus Margulisiibacteriota bacterium]HAR62487.1 hypothetical protein [Candidatus Margulisiibacteriota bacterium]